MHPAERAYLHASGRRRELGDVSTSDVSKSDVSKSDVSKSDVSKSDARGKMCRVASNCNQYVQESNVKG